MASVTHQHGISSDVYAELVDHHMYSFSKILEFINGAAEEQKETPKIRLERKTSHQKLMIFDLDETLAHCTNASKEEYGITEESDVALKVYVGGKVQIANVNIRKSARKVLEEAAKYFEVMVFTASVKNYADAILNYIDPKNELIHH